jgi:hypothetical protein
MILSRVWYVLLGLAVAVALYVVYLGVGQYDRQAIKALKEGLASDSQTVEWALKIDARRRLDALLAGSVEATLQQALVAADAGREGKVPEKSKVDARRALVGVRDAIPADWRPDAIFAIDRDGRLVAQTGYDGVAANDDFEMGGYAAVNDALHGWLRDDMWLLGSKLYVVVARPIEYDAAQRPAGAVVGLKEVNAKFAQDLANRTRASIAFYAGGQRTAAGAAEGFESEKLDAVGLDLKNLDDKTYHDGRSEARMLSADLGAMYARLPGDVWSLGGGFAVLRDRTPLGGPMGFLSSADDKDKANVPWTLLVAVVLFGAVVGVSLTVLEHTFPLRELVAQAERLKAGGIDRMHVAEFRGTYRLAAQALNEGIERAIEKAGGVTRKPADLESILGPVPAAPAMSAFSFPMSEETSPAAPLPVSAAPISPPVISLPVPPPTALQQTVLQQNEAPRSPAFAGATPQAPPAAIAARPPPPLPAAGRPATPASGAKPLASSTNANAAGRAAPPPLPAPRESSPGEDEDATTVSTVPAEVMAQAAGSAGGGPVDESTEWLSVYQEFLRTKRQCGEPIDGLSFEKFSQTLRKNRDALVERHGCKRVKFTVYVKEGRASLKATPVKD